MKSAEMRSFVLKNEKKVLSYFFKDTFLKSLSRLLYSTLEVQLLDSTGQQNLVVPSIFWPPHGALHGLVHQIAPYHPSYFRRASQEFLSRKIQRKMENKEIFSFLVRTDFNYLNEQKDFILRTQFQKSCVKSLCNWFIF